MEDIEYGLVQKITTGKKRGSNIDEFGDSEYEIHIRYTEKPTNLNEIKKDMTDPGNIYIAIIKKSAVGNRYKIINILPETDLK